MNDCYMYVGIFTVSIPKLASAASVWLVHELRYEQGMKIDTVLYKELDSTLVFKPLCTLDKDW